MNKAISLALLCALLAACSSTATKPPEAPPAPAQPVQPAPPPPAATPAPVVAEVESEAAKLARIGRELMTKSVYFDYDKYVVKPEFQAMLAAQADFLKKAPKDSLMLQGNADERGSSEYNLALGQKRAEAVRKALVLLGVDDSRMEAVSFGKEKPRATCHEERCWQENRRVDFVHKLN
jgi:peptidoglycan-associated lipoprotein